MKSLLILLISLNTIVADGFFDGLEVAQNAMSEASSIASESGFVALPVPLYGQMETDPFYQGSEEDELALGGDKPAAYCGPTSIQMILSYYSIEEERHELVQELRPPGTVFGLEKAEAYLQENGFSTERSWVADQEQLRSHVSNGDPVLISVLGNAYIRDGEEVLYKTSFGHIMVLIGFDEDGNPILNDPYGKSIDGHRPPRRIVFPWNNFRRVLNYALLIKPSEQS